MANKTARLGDLATYINGYAFKPADWGDTGLPIIRIQDLTGNSYQLNRYDGEYPERIEVNDGDVLISWSASLGVYVWQRGKALLNQHIFKVVFDKLPVNKEYFVFAVEHKLAEMESKTHGATMKHIVKKDFDGTTIPYPPIEKQAEIADHLRRITSLIDKQTEQLLLLDQLVKSRFIELFGDPKQNPKGYPVKEFDEISVLITDGEHATPRRTDKGIYLLSARNILNHALQLDDVDYIDEEEYTRIARRVVPQAGDVLISCSGSIGRCCVVPEELRFQMVRSAALIRFDDTIKPVFAEWLITSDELQRQISMSATQSSQANLFQGKIRKLRGYVPPMELQNQFAAFVEQTDKSKLAVQKGLQELEILKKSLMQQYFG